ncbi:hypothetical protein [Streptomyces sp. Wb2n-11]|uniref:hypothetical protein n=1 Tax=Streptomyces sp. Wb2n-11 TaxID=1030533 RepID=UPI000B195E88|nr:hypothetical protein [Streptomyces sp. Wb2n-11]
MALAPAVSPLPRFTIHGRSIVITGATGALGSAAARALNALGVRLTLAGGNVGKLDALAAELGRSHDAPWLFNLNFTTPHWPWLTEDDAKTGLEWNFYFFAATAVVGATAAIAVPTRPVGQPAPRRTTAPLPSARPTAPQAAEHVRPLPRRHLHRSLACSRRSRPHQTENPS